MSHTTRARLVGLCLFSIVLATNVFNTTMAQPDTTKRSVDITMLPEAIEIIAIENLQSDSFPIDFKLKLKNVSAKPIYCISALVILPQTAPYTESRLPLGFQLLYGRPALMEGGSRAAPHDVSLGPGESTSLALTLMTARGSFSAISRVIAQGALQAQTTTALELRIDNINFGDGTGYFGGKPWPNIRSGSLSYSNNLSEMRQDYWSVRRFGVMFAKIGIMPSASFASKYSLSKNSFLTYAECGGTCIGLSPGITWYCYGIENCGRSSLVQDPNGTCGKSILLQGNCGELICYVHAISQEGCLAD